MLEASTALRDRLEENTHYFRAQMQANGFAVPEGDHPIVPVMLGDAVVAQKMSERLLELDIFAIGFFYPWCRKEKRAFVCKSQQATQRQISTRPLLLLRLRGTSWLPDRATGVSCKHDTPSSQPTIDCFASSALAYLR